MKQITLFILLLFFAFQANAQNVPIDFEAGGNGAAWTWTVFENAGNPPLGIVANPNASGINVSATVAEFTALQAGNPWAGTESMHGADIGTFTLDPSTSVIKIMVYKPVISDVGIKLVENSSAALPEIKVANTLINQWEELTFDFSTREGIEYDQIVVFPDFDLAGRTQDNVCYFDNVTFNAQPIVDGDITFSVDMSNFAGAFTTVGIFGTFNGWNGASNPLTDLGGGIWEGTVTMPAGDNEYKFILDTGEEVFDGTESCTTPPAAFVNRLIAVNGNATAPLVCYESCDPCSSNTGPNVPIDFEPGGNGADWTWTVFENAGNPPLGIVANPNASGINVSATVAEFTALQAGNPWAGTESMHGADIGTFTLDPSTSVIKIMVYKPVISDVGIKLVENSSAALPEIKVANTLINQWEELTFDFSTREGIEYDQIVVFPDFDLAGRTQDNVCYFDNVTFNAQPIVDGDITFSVDMSNFAGAFTTVGIFGTFNGWNGASNPLTDLGGGIWEGTVTMPAGDNEYKFILDTGEEVFDGTESCTTPPAAFVNRLIAVNGNATAPLVCYESCDPCSSNTGPNVPIDFEPGGNGADWTWTVFENAGNPPLGIVANPNASGTNVSATVAEFTALQAGNPWAGTESMHGADIGTFTLDPTTSLIKIMVYKPVISDVGIKLVENSSAALPEIKVANTLINQWEELTFDFSTREGIEYDQIVVFPDFDLAGRTQDNVCYFDNVTFNEQVAADGDITFSVDMSDFGGAFTTVGIFGTFNGWNGASNPLTDLGGGIWEGTVTMPAGDNEYKFILDTGEEVFDGTESCTTPPATFVNRLIAVDGDATAPLVCYESCDPCGAGPVDGDITFSVDMSEFAGAFTTVSIFGTFNGWNGASNPLTDLGGGIWEGTVTMPAGDNEYKFILDTGEEVFDGTESCTTPPAAFVNRLIFVDGDATAPLVCYESCDPCGVGPVDGAITVSVDMSEYTASFTTVYLSGGFNGWNGTSNPLTDIGGGIWEGTVTMPGGNNEYKFTIDDWTDQEMFNGSESCTTAPGANVNRVLVVDGDATVPTVCFDSCDPCGVGPDDGAVTVSVDMSEYTASFTTVYLSGGFNGWNGTSNPLTDIGGGIWEGTVTMPGGNNEYKFTIDDWTDQEIFNGSESCTTAPGANVNRVLVVDGDATVPTVCFNSCDPCGVGPGPGDVTFSVDMSDFSGAFTTVGLFGTFNGWCGGCNPMTDMGSGIWEVTVNMPGGDNEYKFITDAGEEVFNGSESCTTPPAMFVNRIIAVDGDATVPTVCFNSCDPCGVGPAPGDVTFSVDMSDFGGAFTTVGIFGTFNGWCGGCDPMTDMGNGIWEVTVNMSGGNNEYKFITDAGEEIFDGTEPCTTPPAEFVNRVIAVDGDATIPTVCFNSCEACPPPPGPCLAFVDDDFESYNLDLVVAQAPHIDTWSGGAGTGEDATVTDAQASSGTQSLEINSADPDDLVIGLGDMTSGNFVVRFNMYIPTGSTGYYNLQHQEALFDWAIEVFFNAGGVGSIDHGAGAGDGSFTWTPDTWMQITNLIDLDNDQLIVIIDGQEALRGQFSLSSTGVDLNQLGVLNWFGRPNPGDLFYVDDLFYRQLESCPEGSIICDAFDAWQLGPLSNQAPWWAPWSAPSEDAIVTDEQSLSCDQSMKYTDADPDDQLLLLGDSTSGRYMLAWDQYIPAGSNGYYNLQKFQDIPGSQTGLQVEFLDASGMLELDAGGSNVVTAPYSSDTWQRVAHIIDLDNDWFIYMIDGVEIFAFPNSHNAFTTGGANQIGSVDFFGNTDVVQYIDNVVLRSLPPLPANSCASANDINPLFGQAQDVPQTSSLYNNNDYGTLPSDPTTGFECFGEPDGSGSAPTLENTVWYTFVGDGETYFIETVQCGATDYIDDGDTQIAIYEGTACGGLTPVACNEDGPNATATEYPAGLDLPTVVGTTYYMFVDGFNFNGAIADGEFCVEVTRLTSVDVTEVEFEGGISVYPNPATDQAIIEYNFPESVDMEVQITNSIGQLVMERLESGVQSGNLELDLNGLASGIYFITLSDGVNRLTERLIIQKP